MSYGLFGRKADPEAEAAKARWEARQPAKEFLVTWSEGTQVLAFRDEGSALLQINGILVDCYGVRDAALTGPEHEYLSCECGCGRVFRDGTGNRLSANAVYAPMCPTYRNHPAIVAATLEAK